MANSKGSSFKAVAFDRQQLRLEICSNLHSAMESFRMFKAEKRKYGEPLSEDIEPKIQQALLGLEEDIVNSAHRN